MDVLARRRTGKGNGDSAEETLRVERPPDQSAEAAGEHQSTVPGDETGTGLQGLQGTVEDGSRDAQAQSSRASEVGHPFWSQRAREELQLQLARPDFLGSAVEYSGSRVSSSSTELRAADAGRDSIQGPHGHPTVFGPAPLSTTVGQGRGVAESFPISSSENALAPPTTADHEEQHGLSSRERYVLTQLKDAVVNISQQNSQLLTQNEMLWDRIAKLEEEKSNNTGFHSAQDPLEVVEQRVPGCTGVSSNGDGHGVAQGSQGDDRNALGSIRFEEGFQQGYLAAKDMLAATQAPTQPPISPPPSFEPQGSRDRERTPPPNPLRTLNLQCHTTPQGTPVPKEPPPPDVGVSWSGVKEIFPTCPGFPVTAGSSIAPMEVGARVGEVSVGMMTGQEGYFPRPLAPGSAGYPSVHQSPGRVGPPPYQSADAMQLLWYHLLSLPFLCMALRATPTWGGILGVESHRAR